MLNRILWITPFFCFILGYAITRSLFCIHETIVPSVVGTHLDEAFATLSQNQLNIRLLDHKEDANLPHGTVISQIPAPGKTVKPRQTIFLALSKQPQLPIAPQCIGKMRTALAHELKNSRIKWYEIPNTYPTGQCIAQIPAPQTEMYDKTMTLYIATSIQKHVVWPSFIGRTKDEVITFLEQYGITPRITKQNRTTNSPKISDQRPLPGSIITLDPNNLPLVHLQLQ